MSGDKSISLAEAARLIPDGAVVSVSSSSGLGCPDAMLRALGERFAAEGSPRGLTTIHPIAAGDMYGIVGIDHLARPGLLKRIVAGSYPSGPSSMPAPKIWQMIDRNEVEAYNLPSGVLFHMHADAAAGRPGVLTEVGLDTFVDPRRQGGRMNEAAVEQIVELVEFDGRQWLYFRVIPIDVAIIRATTADERGNLSYEHEGAYLGALDQALAARANGGVVIAQAKRLTTAGSIPPHDVRVPSTLVDYIVLDPDQMQTTQTHYDPAISGEIRRPRREFERSEWGADKVIARRAAMELRHGEAVNLGFGISALAPRVLLEEGLDEAVTWVIEQGAVGGMPLLGFQFGCAANAQSYMPSPAQFTYFQGGGFDRSLLSFLQVDAAGNVNVSRLAARPHVTAGAGGFIDITARARHIVFSGYLTAGGVDLGLVGGRLEIRREGKVAKFVPEVEHVTFSGRMARERGQDVTFVTERCVIRLLDEGLTVIEIAPGVDLERDVLAQSATPLRVSPNLRQMDARLFHPEPMGLALMEREPRRLERAAATAPA
ncbi:MAG: acyl CoA:acetate/3-ketoacid CoA transferase [Thermomicrobiales bacterium]|nr:acyl CoA:acetate/3-ketoacid CoA transferase [Thermomicrobiales bacterium]